MAERINIPPNKADKDSPSWDRWFSNIHNRFNVYTGASDPTVAEVPEGQWIVHRNTTTGAVKIWTNVAGTLKKSAAFT